MDVRSCRRRLCRCLHETKGGTPIAIPTRDVGVNLTLVQILLELRQQTSWLQRIASQLDELTEVNHFTIAIGGALNLQILDDGKGVQFTATPDHPLKPDEVPTWSLSDPTALVVDPNDTVDPTGLSQIYRLPSPAKDVTGLVATISLTRHDGVVVKTDAPAIDIVPDPNAEVGGFVIQEAAL